MACKNLALTRGCMRNVRKPGSTSGKEQLQGGEGCTKLQFGGSIGGEDAQWTLCAHIEFWLRSTRPPVQILPDPRPACNSMLLLFSCIVTDTFAASERRPVKLTDHLLVLLGDAEPIHRYDG